MKWIITIWLIFGNFCEAFGIFSIIDALMGDGKLLHIDWPLGVMITIFGTINLIGCGLLKRAIKRNQL